MFIRIDDVETESTNIVYFQTNSSWIVVEVRYVNHELPINTLKIMFVA